MIQSKNLTVGYSNKSFGPYNYKLKEGSLQILIGKNGAGKSTLIKSLLGILPLKSGTIVVDDRDLYSYQGFERASKLAYVSSGNPIISHVKVADLLKINSVGFDQNEIDNLSRQIKIEHLLDKYLDELSDGELQKAYIARAIAQNTKYIILDEPASHLDISAKLEIFVLLKDMAHKYGKGILCSSHDLELSIKIADQLVLLQGDKLLQGAPEDLILEGHISTAFNSENIAFNPKTGSFDFCIELPKQISYHGEGIEIFWLLKALRRSGFKITEVEKEKAEITFDQGWHYKGWVFKSIEELIIVLHEHA